MKIPFQHEPCRATTTMTTTYQALTKTGTTTVWSRLAGLVFVTLAFSLPAAAELGGYVDSVQVDRAKMKATLKITQTKAYAVHEIKAPSGTVVREYVSPDGRVFGVAWQGPFLPDLSQILGSFYQQYAGAVQGEKRTYVGHRPVDIQQPRLVVQGGGRMLGHFGRAFVPDMLPEGVSTDAIR
jgi:hypothetical protein